MAQRRFSVAFTALIVSLLGSAETFLVPLIPNMALRGFVAASIPFIVVFLYQEEGSSPIPVQTIAPSIPIPTAGVPNP